MEKLKRIKKPLQRGVAKVPVVMQMEALECGAACLTMVLAYYGKWIPLEQVRSDCGVSRDGSKAKNILRAARSYGLVAKGYRYETESLRNEGKFPCIIHWNFSHFVVLTGFRGNKAILNDPAKGTYAVSMETFDSSFSGICLMFEPGEEFKPSGKKKSVIKFAANRLKGAGAQVAFTMFTGVIASLIGIISPTFSRIFIDRLLTGKNPDWFVPFIIAISAFTFISIVVEWLRAIYSLKINGKFAAVGNATYFWHILHLPMTFFSQRMAGDIAGRQALNASIANTLVNTFVPLLLDTGMMLFYLIVMIRYSWLLTIIGIFSIFINFIVSRFISNRRINITRVQMRDRGLLSGVTVAGIEMIETIKASGAEKGFFQRWAGYQANVNAAEVKEQKINQYLGIIPSIVSSLCSIAVLMFGVYFTMNGSFTIGMITAFQGFLSSFTSPALELISAGQTIQEMRTEMERVEDVMAYPEDSIYSDKEDSAQSNRKLSGNITMKHVTFGYSKLEAPLIENFNLELKPGKSVALVGSSGCGKSTLSKLISGLYQPWSGEILFDGKTPQEIGRNVFTGSLAVVDQDIILFADTISNNIKMWDNTIEDFEVILAARDAHIHEDIMLREGGYQGKIIEGGRDLSGGQRQRLEIARALAQDPTIIIMDEATSALDAKTEYEVIKSIKDRGITTIVVAHRLSTIRDCDEIIVLDHGKAVERGTHDELYAKGGLYTKLVTSD